MSKVTVREVVGFTGVVLSLVFVGIQVNQNTVAARAAAYQAMGEGLSEFWFETSQSPELSVLMLRFFEEEDAEFSATEEAMIIARAVSNHRRHETIWRQVEIGLLGPEVMEHLGNNAPNGPAAAGNLARFWPRIAPMMSPDYRTYIEEARGYSPSTP